MPITLNDDNATFSATHAEKIEDVIDALPEHAREIVERLRDGDREGESRVVGKFEQMEALRKERENVQGSIVHLEKAWARGGKVIASDEKMHARLTASLEKIDARLRDVQAIAPKRRLTFTQFERWAAKLPAGSTFRAIKVPPPKGDLAAALERNLAQHAELVAERRTIERAPLPIEDARAAMLKAVDRLAARGAPKVGALFHRQFDGAGRLRQGEIEFPSHTIFGADGQQCKEFDALEIFAFLAKPIFVEGLERLLAEKTPPDARPLEGREEEMTKIDAEIARLELEEGAIYVAADRSPTLAIERRDTLDMAAALQVEVLPPPPPISSEQVRTAWYAFRAKAGDAKADAVLKQFRVAENALSLVEPAERAEFIAACAV
jgi:hypothetical protein